MKIERIHVAQVAAVAPLFNEYRMFYEQESDMAGAEQFLYERLQRQESIIFVAIVDGEYVGFTQLYPTFSSVAMRKAYILNDLFVRQTARRQGVAENLMARAFDYVKEQDARFLKLETAVTNGNAQALYEKMGMVVEAEMKNYIMYWS
ncbi:MAG: GNAT family N-acetyltransferase [Solibacillus sp.]